MIWEAVGVGVPLVVGAGVAVVKFHTRLSVVETKHEALRDTVDRIEGKVDNLPEKLAAAVAKAKR
jgi:hypothetical protein